MKKKLFKGERENGSCGNEKKGLKEDTPVATDGTGIRRNE